VEAARERFEDEEQLRSWLDQDQVQRTPEELAAALNHLSGSDE
jgi:hypothetical protein